MLHIRLSRFTPKLHNPGTIPSVSSAIFDDGAGDVYLLDGLVWIGEAPDGVVYQSHAGRYKH